MRPFERFGFEILVSGPSDVASERVMSYVGAPRPRKALTASFLLIKKAYYETRMLASPIVMHT